MKFSICNILDMFSHYQSSNVSTSTASTEQLVLDEALDCRVEIVSTFRNIHRQEEQKCIFDSLVQKLQGSNPIEALKSLIIIDLIVYHLSADQRSTILSLSTQTNQEFHEAKLANLIEKYKTYVQFKTMNASVTQTQINQALESNAAQAINYIDLLVKQLIYLCKTASLCYNQNPYGQELAIRILRYLLRDSSVLVKFIEFVFTSLSMRSSMESPQLLDFNSRFLICKDALKYHHREYLLLNSSFQTGLIQQSKLENAYSTCNLRRYSVPRGTLQILPTPDSRNFQQGNVRSGRFSVDYSSTTNINKLFRN